MVRLGTGRKSATPRKGRDGTAATLKRVAEKKLILDVHCHYLDYMQETEGIQALCRAMDKGGVGYAVLTGCPYKKTWNPGDNRPSHPLYDDGEASSLSTAVSLSLARSWPPAASLCPSMRAFGPANGLCVSARTSPLLLTGDLYFYSMTDALLFRDLDKAQEKDMSVQSRFSMMVCGFNLTDMNAGKEAQNLIDHFPVAGFGKLVFQSDDFNSMTIKGGMWTYSDPAIKALVDIAAQQPSKMPIVFRSDACSVTTKPYRGTPPWRAGHCAPRHMARRRPAAVQRACMPPSAPLRLRAPCAPPPARSLRARAPLRARDLVVLPRRACPPRRFRVH